MSARELSSRSIKNAEKSTSQQQNGTGAPGADTNPDPELQHDVDIHFPRQPRPSATTRSNLSSGRSRKSKKSDTIRPPIDPANVVLSRSRPIKPHENEPFLTIDNLPPEKTFVSEKSTLSGYGSPRHVSNKGQQPVPVKSPVTAQLQRMSVYMTPYSREAPGGPSPSVVSGKISPNKARKSPSPLVTKSRPASGSRPNSCTQNGNRDDMTEIVDTGTDAVPAKMLKASAGSNSPTERVMKENSSRPTSGTGVKHLSRPSTGSQSGSRPGTASRPGTGSRFGRIGSGGKQRGNRSIPSRAGRITPANTPFQSPTKQLNAPNHQLKSPFKHYVSKPDMASTGRNTPSMGLKERTALAAYHINKMITVAGEKDASKVRGRLQKGKLKPLYPVSVDGPSINNCRGIISETRSYASSPSRTLQRHLHLMSTIPNVHEYLYDRPRTVESVHRTSIASSVDDNLDYEETDMLPDEIIYPAPLTKAASILEPRTPENTFFPINEPHDIQDERHNEKGHTVFTTEVNAPASDDVSISTQLQEVCSVRDGSKQNNNASDQNNSNTDTSEQKAGDEEQPDEGTLGSAQLRGISSSKSVRFADDGGNKAKEIKQMTNSNIAMQQKTQETLGLNGNNINDNTKPVEGKADALDNKKDNIHDVNVGENNEDDVVAKKNKQNSGCKSDELNELRKLDKDSDDEGEMDENKKADGGNSSNVNVTNTGISENSKSEKTNQDKPVDKAVNDKECIEQTDVSCDKARNSANGNRESKPVSGKAQNLKRSSTASKRSNQTRSSGSSRPSSAKRSTSSDRLHKSKKGESCSKFDKSPASKAHTHKLEVSSVIHGSSVHVGLRPESPNRSPSRSTSPSRQPNMFRGRDHSQGANFSGRDSWCRDLSSDLYGNNGDLHDLSSNRSKVKFMLDNEEPEVETIFVEDEEDVRLRQDTQISFDTLEAEINALRMNIHDGMNQIALDNNDLENGHIDQETDSESDETIVDSENSFVPTETNSNPVETVRGDYMDILEKYRQQCMNRSEKIGAISALLVTPREAGSVMSSSKNSIVDIKGNNQWHMDEDQTEIDPSQRKYQTLTNMVSSDSGRGSVENLSEFSQSASISVCDIPKLDLGGSTSDLELDTGRSEGTLLSGKNNETAQEGRKLLEMVCDQLSAKAQKETKANRKDEEEDVTKLKVVATTKSLSKSKRPGVNLSANKSPYPPLCFTINARPPAGYLYYFAYGPDMNPDRFKSYIMREDVTRYWGLLFGFNLVFNKRGTSEEAGGFSNIEFNPLRSVEGCLYKITSRELQVLDKCIGYPEHYQHLMLPVWMSNSPDPDNLGVAQYCVPALMYIAQNAWTETERPLNHDYSLSQCIKSADLVTKEYKDNLVAMTTQKEGQPIESAA